MLKKNTEKVYISKANPINNYGEISKKWEFKKNPKTKDGSYRLNIQQNINELDVKSTGEVDYERRKAVTRQNYDINKGDGISFENISSLEVFKPEFIVKDKVKVGVTTTYILEKNND